MIQGGVVVIVCDQCGFEDKVKTIDHVPIGWYVLHVTGATGIPERGKHLCTQECVINHIKE